MDDLVAYCQRDHGRWTQGLYAKAGAGFQPGCVDLLWCYRRDFCSVPFRHRGLGISSYKALFGVTVAGGLQGIAMLMRIHAFQCGKALFVAPFRLMALLWAAILARVLFGETFTMTQVFGAVLICAALAAFAPSQGRQANAP